MRFTSLVAIGVSTIALSGCSFLTGHNGYSNSHHGVNADDCCVGGQSLSKWNIEGTLGTEAYVGGDVFTGNEVHGGFVGTSFNSLDMKDAYKAGYAGSVGTSYAINPNRKLTGSIGYNKAKGNDKIIGLNTVSNNSLRGKLSDFESIALEAGLRQYFTPRYAGSTNFQYRPYIEGKLGAANVEDITLTYRESGVPASSKTVNLYDGGWVPTAAGLVGFEVPLARRATLGIETGIRYTGALDASNKLVAQAPELGGANRGEGAWSVPVQLRGRYRF